MKLAWRSPFVNRWLWLCPALAVLLAAGVLMFFGFSWWSALLAALLLVCPVLIVWGAVQVALEERREQGTHARHG